MARKRVASSLHLLTVKQIQNAPEGDLSDGGGLTLRIRGESASWVFRYTAATGKRREMGLGIARMGSSAQIGDSVTTARDLARDARDLLQRGIDPIDERDGRRIAALAIEEQKRAAANASARLWPGPLATITSASSSRRRPTSTQLSGFPRLNTTCRPRSGTRRSTASPLRRCWPR